LLKYEQFLGLLLEHYKTSSWIPYPLEDLANPCATGRKNALLVVSGAGGELRFVTVRLD